MSDAASPRVAIAVANRDFDLTEVVVPWARLRAAGFEVDFATGDGEQGACDPLLLSGVVFGKLGARPGAIALYEEMCATAAWRVPLRYAQLDPEHHLGLLLPGGHAKGMRQYLESGDLQNRAAAFLAADRPVAAICHGPIVLARTIDPSSGRSVLAGRTVTALTRSLEQTAWMLTAWKLGDYYRTYPEWVESEMKRALGESGSFETGPLFASYDRPWHVLDGKLLTARWPGDATAFADALVALVQAERAAHATS